MEQVVLEVGGERKVYEAPTVVFEAPLEVRAGSPFVMPEGLEEVLGQ